MATMTNGKLEGFLKKSISVVEISDGLTFFEICDIYHELYCFYGGHSVKNQVNEVRN